MWIELWIDDQKRLINTDHIRRVLPTGKGEAIEVWFDGPDWDIDDNEPYVPGEAPSVKPSQSVYIFDASYVDFIAALQSGQAFVSLAQEPE